MRVSRIRSGVCAHVVLLACALVTRASGSPLVYNQRQLFPEAACPVAYSSQPQTIGPGLRAPLLLGGVWGGCESGCQPRDDAWGRICQADPDALAVINVCEYWQRPELLETAMRVSNGAVEQFNPCDLYQYLKGRTLWLIGDSHTKNLYNAMRCFLIDFFDHSDGECAASSDSQLQSLLEQAALRGHVYNTPPRCIHIRGGGRVCLVHNPMGSTMVSIDEQVMATLQLLHTVVAAPADIFMISFGRWHSNNCDGVDGGYVEALEQVGAYLKKQRLQFPYVFFQPSSHDHTRCTNGVFNDTLPLCLPAAEGGYDLGISAELHHAAHGIMTGKYGIPVVDSHEASLFLHNGHVMARQTIAGKTDCLHYCRPGMPELDMWYMTSSFRSSNIPQLPSITDQVRQCVKMPLQTFKPYGAQFLVNNNNNSNTVEPVNNNTDQSLTPQPVEPPSSGEDVVSNTITVNNSTGIDPTATAADSPTQPPPSSSGEVPSDGSTAAETAHGSADSTAGSDERSTVETPRDGTPRSTVVVTPEETPDQHTDHSAGLIDDDENSGADSKIEDLISSVAGDGHSKLAERELADSDMEGRPSSAADLNSASRIENSDLEVEDDDSIAVQDGMAVVDEDFKAAIVWVGGDDDGLGMELNLTSDNLKERPPVAAYRVLSAPQQQQPQQQDQSQEDRLFEHSKLQQSLPQYAAVHIAGVNTTDAAIAGSLDMSGQHHVMGSRLGDTEYSFPPNVLRQDLDHDDAATGDVSSIAATVSSPYSSTEGSDAAGGMLTFSVSPQRRRLTERLQTADGVDHDDTSYDDVFGTDDLVVNVSTVTAGVLPLHVQEVNAASFSAASSVS